jgi:multiple sugar transport system permease protein
LLITFDDSMKTLPVSIAAFAPVVGTHTQLEGFAVGMAGITILSLPSLLLFLGLQRYFIQGIASGALRG